MPLTLRFTFSFLFSLSTLILAAQSQEGFEITKEMLRISNGINTMHFDMTKTERIGEEYFTESFATKLTYDPFLLYSKKIEEGKTPEILFRQGENNNNALVNPDGFPWFNLNLDPMGVFMRKNQHHTLYETGYKYALSIIEHLFNKYEGEIPAMTRMLDNNIVNDRDCFIIEFNNEHFGFEEYEVKKDENILDIAKRNLISEYMIVERNENVEHYNDVEEGQIILIPNGYCPKIILSIDIERHIPISLKIFENDVLFEQFEYRNVIVNPTFNEDVFLEKNPDYGF